MRLMNEGMQNSIVLYACMRSTEQWDKVIKVLLSVGGLQEVPIALTQFTRSPSALYGLLFQAKACRTHYG